MQRHIYDPGEHLWWSHLAKNVFKKAVNFFLQESPTIQVSGVWIPEKGRYDLIILV